MKADKVLLPEEQELEHKRSELDEKQSLLADRELELATIRTKAIAFERIYMEKVGRLYVELDELQAQLTRLRFPDNNLGFTAVRQAEKQAEESRAEYERKERTSDPTVGKIEPSQELKSLYRKLAKQFHPDSTLEPDEKSRGTEIMAQINEAYMRRDLVTLQRMTEELATSPESISGDGIGNELIRVIRKIAQIDRRLAVLEQELISFKKSDLFRLQEQHELGRQQGIDLLERIATDLARRIAETRVQIHELKST